MEDEEKGTHIDDKERAEIPTLLLVSDDELGLGVPFLDLVHVPEPHVRHEEPDEGDELAAAAELPDMHASPALACRVPQHLAPHPRDDLPHEPG